MGLIYLDSCLLIYAFERHPVFGQAIIDRLSLYPANQFAITPLVKMECLVAPIKHNNLFLMEYYQKGLSAFHCLNMIEEVYLVAARLRAKYGLKAQDALHLATAQYYQCSEFWTNDHRLNKAAQQLIVKNALE